MDKLRESLGQLEETGVIIRVTESTHWVYSLVITEKKNGKIRLCHDPQELNTAIRRHHSSIPTPTNIQSRLADKRIFTILCEKDNYWQIKLDKASSLLCTFNMPWGRYRFKRLPFGIKSASDHPPTEEQWSVWWHWGRVCDSRCCDNHCSWW